MISGNSSDDFTLDGSLMVALVPETKLCELWWSQSGGSHTFFTEDNASARASLEPDAVLQWKVEARSWKDACTKMHEYLGREPYEPERNAADDWNG
jgi:hypothetical protein